MTIDYAGITAQVHAEWMAITHEDMEEKGWGCKDCGRKHSPSWWRCEGDIYCLDCKKALWRELRVRSTQVQHRAA